jgi:hypothetical protein
LGEPRRNPGQILIDPITILRGSEVRINKATYGYIRENKLYNMEEQKKLATSGMLNLVFPPAAKEIKAHWRPIDEADKRRYHWSEVVARNGEKQVWGLTALHISTKDLPNWFWATFEHIDNKKPRLLPNDDRPNEGWQFPSVDRFSCAQPPHDCDSVPKNFGIEGTKWENYRLRGTQTDFVRSTGEPTKLANSQIESGHQDSSCITCHAYAARDASGGLIGRRLDVGAPNPDWFKDPNTGQRKYMQLDFVFALDRATFPTKP